MAVFALSSHDVRGAASCTTRILFAVSSLVAAMIAPPAASAESGGAAVSLGPGEGHVVDVSRDLPCDFLVENSDTYYESFYAWQYGGVVAPSYGAFAECYPSFPPTGVCGAIFDLTQTGNQNGQTMDVYLWEDDRGTPGAVACLVTNVEPGPVATWPAISRHVVDFGGCSVVDAWVGYWGAWPGEVAGWFIGADTNGFGGCSFTNIAPGIGYPIGWQHVSVVWGADQVALGISALTPNPSLGACCYEDGSCVVQMNDDCASGLWVRGAECDPDPCIPFGACCFSDGSCRFLTEGTCEVYLGAFYPNDACVPNPCPPLEQGACCLPDTTCQFVLTTVCHDLDGTFLGQGTDCDPNPCLPDPVGACCYNGECYMVTELACFEVGSYLGDGVPCEPNPCDPSPTLESSWGRIKDRFRSRER